MEHIKKFPCHVGEHFLATLIPLVGLLTRESPCYHPFDLASTHMTLFPGQVHSHCPIVTRENTRASPCHPFDLRIKLGFPLFFHYISHTLTCVPCGAAPSALPTHILKKTQKTKNTIKFFSFSAAVQPPPPFGSPADLLSLLLYLHGRTKKLSHKKNSKSGSVRV